MAIVVTAPQLLKCADTADFGDEIHVVAEPWQSYDIQRTPQVSYPVYLGEVLNGRYLVEHKLGHGGFSTVWMARDLMMKRDVALKVMFLGEYANHESRMQDEIAKNVRDTSHLVMSLESFLVSIPGESGRQHKVLVFPLMGPYLGFHILRKISLASRMSAARQLLEALKSLHEAGIVHRDLDDRNCLWGMKPIHNLSRQAKYKLLNRPLRQSIPHVDLPKKGDLVRPVDIPENLRTEQFYLADFGLAMNLRTDSVPKKGYPPMQFCSPDRLHKEHPSPACDMWSYMVLFGEIYLGVEPFLLFHKGGIVSAFVKSLGPLPEKWKGHYTHPQGQDSWYDQDQKPDPKFSLASIIQSRRPDADPIEREHVRDIMSKVFIYDPETHLTAKQLLQDPSFRAIMDKYGC